MPKIKRGYSCFEDITWKERIRENPFQKIKRWVTNVRRTYHRAKYGFCDFDVWEMDSWFLAVVPAMLEHLRNNHSGFPDAIYDYYPEIDRETDEDGEKASQKWDEILTEMINVFDELYPYESRGISASHNLTPAEVRQRRDELKARGFELFSRWFFNLWN